MMDFHYTKLVAEAVNDTIADMADICLPYCEPTYDLGYCQDPCLAFCNSFCPSELPPSPSPTLSVHHPNRPNKILITSLLVLATTSILVFCYAVYISFCKRQRRWRTQREPPRNGTTHDEFLDEEHGPVVDHPIWYINTVGLQPSVINSIAIFKYKRGGVVDGTECSVCLSEFQEDETLRLLPKCSHAFHIPCIDTWLRSHTNCPMCRAPIVVNTSRTTTTTTISTTSEGHSGDSSTEEETRIRVSEDDQESDHQREMEGGDSEFRVETEEEDHLQGENRRTRCEDEEGGVQALRRSVSLDSLSAFKISQAVVTNVLPVEMESDRNSDMQEVKEMKSDMGTVAKIGGGNKSLMRLMANSSIGRSLQIGPSSLKRSFSCSGKLFLARYGSNRNSVLPF